MSEMKIPSWISFRVKPGEYEKIHDFFSKSTCLKLSEYARSVLLQRPVIFRTRNESADEFLTEMLLLKMELNHIGNNYNQAVRKLHSLNHIEEVKWWLTRHELLHENFLTHSETILERLNEIHRLWLSK